MNLTEEARKERNRYSREWRSRQTPEKLRGYQKRYWEKKAKENRSKKTNY